MIDRQRGIVSDSKSGVSGAGKEPTARTHFVSVADNFSAYSVFNHRHTGEILEQLGLQAPELIFTPHLLPIPRGILSTLYVHLRNANNSWRDRSVLPRLLQGEGLGKGFRHSQIAGDPVLGANQLLRSRLLPRRGWTPAGAGFMRRQPVERRGRTSSAEHESDVWLERGRRTAVKIVIKIGGAALEDKLILRKCAKAIVELAQDGHRVAVVHGGGSALTRTLGLLGKTSSFVNGLRVTDAETRDVALMVLAGIVNKQMVAAISSAGHPSVGLCGGDGMMFRARKKRSSDADLGFVGEIISADSRWVEAIWGGGGIPVISSVALGTDGEYYNINADQIAAACAGACHADALIFLTDVAGVKDAGGTVIPWLSTKQVPAMIQESVIAGGMLPKLDACSQALKRGVGRVRILPASLADVLPQFYFARIECGTEVTCA